MARLRPWPVVALVAWTLFTWVNRVPLLWTDDDQTGSEKLLGSIPIVVFVTLAAVAGVGLLRSDDRLGGWARVAGVALGTWSIAYWVVRLPFILANDHPGPFKVVHTVLATVAVGLGTWALRAIFGARSGEAVDRGVLAPSSR